MMSRRLAERGTELPPLGARPLIRLSRLLAGALLAGVCLPLNLPAPVSASGSPAGVPQGGLPGFEQVRAGFRSSETLLLDRHGEIIHRLRTRRDERRGSWTPLERISAAMQQALLLSEDRRFHEHAGIDWLAIPAAAWSNLWQQPTRGASTLSMQLAGLLDPRLQPSPGQHRSIPQKLAQAHAAWQLEQHWQKWQILEAYLNLVPFRGELVGIDALSRSLFGKAAHGLDRTEAALAAALVRGPNAPAAQVADRACIVLQAMGGKDCHALTLRAMALLSRPRHWAPSDGIAPHLMRHLLASAGHRGGAHPPPRQIRSTLDARIQRMALQSLEQHLRELQGRQVEDGAVLVLDNARGEVLAWVGSSGSLSRASEVDAVTARRQPGSTLKPLLYAQAIEEQRLTAGSLLHDTPTHLPAGSGLYMPENYDHHFKGWVSVRTALAASLNIPAVRTLTMVTPAAFHRQLARFGIELAESSGYYGYSLALGSAEVSLLQLANAYRTLANGGRYCPIRLQPASPAAAATSTVAATPATITRPATADRDTAAPPSAGTGTAAGTAAVTTAGTAAGAVAGTAAMTGAGSSTGSSGCRQAIGAGAAFITADILADRQARAITFGSASVLDTGFWSAVKTGTSKDMRDNWAVGWSDRYTIAVWVGNADNQPMHDVSGTSGAAPVWADMMRQLHAGQPSRPPSPPAGLARQAIQYDNRIEAPRLEWFLPGTRQAQFRLASSTAASNPPAIAMSEDGGLAAAASRSTEWPALNNQPPQHRLDAHIVAPAPGSIIALDPDIPPRYQRLVLRARLLSGQASGLRWLVGEQLAGRGREADWAPRPGRHRLQLLDPAGRLLDEVTIEVRGARQR